MSERDKMAFCPFCFAMSMQTFSGSERKSMCQDCGNEILHKYYNYLERNLLTTDELKTLRTQLIALEKNVDQVLRAWDKIDREEIKHE